MQNQDNQRLRALITLVKAVLAVLAAFGFISIGAGNPAGLTTDTATVVKTHTLEQPSPVTVDPGQQLSPDQAKQDSTKPAEVLPADAPVTQEDIGPAIHEDMRDETPPGVPAQQIKQGAALTQKLASKTLVAPENPAGAQNYQCSSHPVVNHSALTHRIIGVALHFTVSDPGSHEGVWRLFNTPSFGASSTYLFEPLDSLCWQLISLGQKSWAQLSANSYYWSIEIVTNDRTRGQWLATDMFKRGTLAALVADLLKKAGAPARLVDPVGCVFLAGVTDHSRLECGNTHWDVGPGFPWDVFMGQVRDHYNGAAYKPACSKRCRRVKHLRAKHQRTHARFLKNKCSYHGIVRHGGYCETLRHRNKAVHQAATREHVSLAGTYK